MAFLWDKPENDEGFEKAEWLRLNTDGEDEDDAIGKDYRALCSVYYDVFNNGGCNLHIPFYQDHIERLYACGVTFGLDTPCFIELLEVDDEGSWAEIVDNGPMDQFARDLIDNLYASLNPEVQL
jgi:hypothetical protein